ncbi:MAG: YfhO family protein [Candidatus Daviesbacteria bacterium]
MHLKEVIIVFVFYILLTLIFFYKIFLGLIPLPADLIVGAYHPWLDYKWGYDAGVPIHNPLLSDAVSIFYPLKTLAAEFLKQGQLPLWNSYMFGGYPLFASVQLGVLFPTMVFYLLFSSPVAWTLQTISQPFLASFFMYLLLRHLNLDKLSSVFGSIAYGFGGFTLVWMQWNTQATTSMFLPILILLEEKYLASKQLKWGLLLSIFLALQFFAGYLPIIPFTFITMTVWYLFRSSRLLSDLKILFFIILGLLLSAIFLLPVVELIQISQRTIETLGTESPFISLENFISLIAPDFFGNPATHNFWGKGNYLDSTLYTGITVLIFSILGLKNFFNKIPVRFAISLLVMSIILSVSNPLSTFLYNFGVWGGASLTMNRINFLVNFSLSILGAYGFSLIKNNYSKLSIQPGVWILSLVLGAVIGLLSCRWFLLSNLASDEINLWLTYINVSLRNLILPILIIVALLILILLAKKLALFRLITAVSFILILIFELFRFGLKFNTFAKTEYIYPETPISKFLEQYPNERIVAEKDVFSANMWVPFKLSSITGYDGIYPVNIAQLLATADSGKVDAPPQARWGILTNFDSKILDETNTRFVVAVKRDSKGQVSESGQVSSKLMLPKYKEVFSDKGVAVLENTQSFPRVYLTKQVIKASDQDALKLMQDENFPIKRISITDNFEFNNVSSATLDTKVTYNPLTNSRVQINTTSNMDAYLVVLDSFYPGWKALINGKETTIYRTNYNFRGVFLPKGVHTVEFIYTPKSLELGAIISGISILIIISLIVIPRFLRRLQHSIDK